MQPILNQSKIGSNHIKYETKCGQLLNTKIEKEVATKLVKFENTSFNYKEESMVSKQAQPFSVEKQIESTDRGQNLVSFGKLIMQKWALRKNDAFVITLILEEAVVGILGRSEKTYKAMFKILSFHIEVLNHLNFLLNYEELSRRMDLA